MKAPSPSHSPTCGLHSAAPPRGPALLRAWWGALGAACAVLLAFPAGGAAQERPDGETRWGVESEVGASVFFGASDQTTVATKLGVERAGERFEVEGDLSFLYGEATNDDGATFVNKRSWSLGTNVGYRGFEHLNPYAFVSALSSLEKKIHRRYKGGAGARLTAIDREETRLDFAAALLAEKTLEASDDDGSELLARWTGQFSFRRSFDGERMEFQAKAEYNPVFDEFANYTIEAASSLAFKVSAVLSLKLSVEDNYDSRAKSRGARDNNDGRVLFSVLASF